MARYGLVNVAIVLTSEQKGINFIYLFMPSEFVLFMKNIGLQFIRSSEV